MEILSNIIYKNFIIVLLLLTCLFLGACNLNTKNQKKVNEEDVIGIWLSYYNDAETKTIHSKEILIFCSNFYARIIQNAKNDMVHPKEKYKYTTGREGEDIIITPETFPYTPPFKISSEQGLFIMRQQWPPSFIINKGGNSYKKISEEEANNILKTWMVSTVNFQTLPIAK